MARRHQISIPLSELDYNTQKSVRTALCRNGIRNMDVKSICITGYSEFSNKFKKAGDALRHLEAYISHKGTGSVNEYVTATELSRILKINRLTLTRWIDSGALRFHASIPTYRKGLSRPYYQLSDVKRKIKNYVTENNL